MLVQVHDFCFVNMSSYWLLEWRDVMNYHVKKTGSDLNPGTEDKPFLTISRLPMWQNPVM